jgi:hypothetical protein
MESKGVDFEYKQDILEGTAGIESVTSNLMEVFAEMGKSIGCQKNICQLREQLIILQQESSLISAAACNESIQQERAVQLSSEIYSVIQKIENILLATMKLKEEVDASISQAELMSLLCTCKKISDRINSHILIQDRMKTPPSSPVMFKNDAETCNSKNSDLKPDTEVENISQLEEVLTNTAMHQENINQETENLSDIGAGQDFDRSSPNSMSVIKEINLETSSNELEGSQTQETIKICKQTEQYSSESILEVDCLAGGPQLNKPSNENTSQGKLIEVSKSESDQFQQNIGLQNIDVNDKIAVEIFDDETLGSDRSVGILNTIKGKLSNVFSKSEESVQIDENECTEILQIQNLDAEDTKKETGFIASIKNRVGGFFYSQQDSKSETSSSEYVYLLTEQMTDYSLIMLPTTSSPYLKSLFLPLLVKLMQQLGVVLWSITMFKHYIHCREHSNKK